MALIYALGTDNNGSSPTSYSDWTEDYTSGPLQGDAPGVNPTKNWNLDLASPAVTANGGDPMGGIEISSLNQLTDDGGTSSDPLNSGDGNIDAGEWFSILVDTTGDGNPDTTYYGQVDYFFTPNANADTSLMVFVLYDSPPDVNNDPTGNIVDKYAYNLGNSDPAETDDQKVEGGWITEGMTNQGKTFDSFEDRVIVCFVRGTKIATPTGEVLIEDIVIGDRVLTADSGTQIVRWTGSKKLKPSGAFTPIRIKAGALGNEAPNQDLLVSPAHRMLISGWRAEVLFGEPEYLVAAKDLVNDSTILVAHDLAEVEYFHILFDKHEIVTSNGTPSESFHPNADALSSLSKEARAELFALFPELETKSKNGNYSIARQILTASEVTLLK